ARRTDPGALHGARRRRRRDAGARARRGAARRVRERRAGAPLLLRVEGRGARRARGAAPREDPPRALRRALGVDRRAPPLRGARDRRAADRGRCEELPRLARGADAMKRTHRADLRCWSRFDPARNLDFNAWAWLRPGGTVLVDPLPLSDHDRAELEAAGPVSYVIVTNGDHVRAAPELVARYGAELIGPAGERGSLELACDRWAGD